MILYEESFPLPGEILVGSLQPIVVCTLMGHACHERVTKHCVLSPVIPSGGTEVGLGDISCGCRRGL